MLTRGGLEQIEASNDIQIVARTTYQRYVLVLSEMRLTSRSCDET